MNMKKIIVAGCAGAVFGLLAQGTVSLASAGGDRPVAGVAMADDMVKVLGRGVGLFRDEALKDACRDAIESAMGRYVDAEQMVKNDELVSAHILTQSNAYIEKYDVTKETKGADGLVTLRILATVKMSKLTKKLSEVLPPQSFKLGSDAQNCHVSMVMQEKLGEDAVALLKKALDGVNPITQMIRLSLADTKMLTGEIGNSNDKKTVYFYRFKFELDEKKYYEDFLPPLLKVLDQISLENPKTVRLQSVAAKFTSGSSDYGFLSKKENVQNYISSGEDVNNTYKSSRRQGTSTLSLSLDGLSYNMEHGRSEGKYEGVVALGNTKDYWYLSYGSGSPEFGKGIRFEIPSRSPDERGNNPDLDDWKRHNSHVKSMLETDGFQVMVITELNASRNSAKARYYKLPKGCAEAILRWQWRLCAGYDREGSFGRTAYNIILKDKDGEEVVVRSIAFRNVALINAMVGQGKMFEGRFDEGDGWYVTPMIHTDAKSMHRWIGFDIPRDDLSKIASISIELAE